MSPLLLTFLADPAPPAGAAPTEGPGNMLIWGVGLFAIFYFMLIRPQKKDAQRREKMLSELKKHDWVVTHSGIIGQVAEVSDDVITLKVDDNQGVRMRFKRIAIASMLDPAAGKDASKDAAKREGENGKPDPAAESRSSGRASR